MWTIEQLYDKFLVSSGVNTDTRTIEFDQFFVALKGANFNGNAYADEALSKGAIYALVDDEEFATTDQHLLVDDCLTTLQELANFHRKMMDIPVLAITGSNGKTTTKELCQAVLSTTFETFATKGNLNNHIGVPLSLLSIQNYHQVAIIEMGANHVGEIADLCKIAEPDFGLITNIGTAHIEGFGSQENIVKAKTELYDYLATKEKSILFVNEDDRKLMRLSEEFERKLYGKTSEFFRGVVHPNETTLKLTIDDDEQEFTIVTNLFGEYNFYNALCAGAIGKYFGVPLLDIAEAIEQYSPSNNRSQIIEKEGVTYVLDAYNANPSSMKLAIEQFSQLKAENKLAVLGSMLELGALEQEAHQEVVNLCERLNLKAIFIGQEFEAVAPKAVYFSSVEEYSAQFKADRQTFTTILLKGSRGIKLEMLVH